MIERIKWFKGASGENDWFAAILTSGFIKLTLATTATSVGSLASLQKSQRSIICGHLKVSRKGFEVFLLFASCPRSVERIYRRVVPKIKNEMGNHPSHDTTFNR